MGGLGVFLCRCCADLEQVHGTQQQPKTVYPPGPRESKKTQAHSRGKDGNITLHLRFNPPCNTFKSLSSPLNPTDFATRAQTLAFGGRNQVPSIFWRFRGGAWGRGRPATAPSAPVATPGSGSWPSISWRCGWISPVVASFLPFSACLVPKGFLSPKSPANWVPFLTLSFRTLLQ